SGGRLLLVVSEGHALLVVDLEDGEQIGEVQALAHALVQVQELQLRSKPLADRVARHELPRARAVDGGHLGEVEEDLLPALGEKLVHDVAENLVADSHEELPREVDDHDVVCFADFYVHQGESYREAPKLAESRPHARSD